MDTEAAADIRMADHKRDVDVHHCRWCGAALDEAHPLKQHCGEVNTLRQKLTLVQLENEQLSEQRDALRKCVNQLSTELNQALSQLRSAGLLTAGDYAKTVSAVSCIEYQQAGSYEILREA